MDTVYYNLTARRIKVSGGPDLLKFVSTGTALSTGSKVLDFQRCRRHLETKAALKQLNQEAEEFDEPEAEHPEISTGSSRQGGAWSWLEACASLCVIAVSAAAITAFFVR